MELWDIYDKNKVRTGRTMERNHFNLADDEYHLTVLGVIARPDGRFLITKRVMTKAWAPGWWEVSGGAAQAGEESEEAVQRQDWMSAMPMVDICLLTTERTRVRVTIIL